MSSVEQDERPSNGHAVVVDRPLEETTAKKENPRTQRSVSYFELFRYANAFDWCLLVLAFLGSVIRSLAFPIVIVIYSEMTAMFIDRHLGTSTITHFLPLFGGGKIL